MKKNLCQLFYINRRNMCREIYSNCYGVLEIVLGTKSFCVIVFIYFHSTTLHHIQSLCFFI